MNKITALLCLASCAFLGSFAVVKAVGGSSNKPVVEAWKTYSNTSYGFSIQYPPDWTYREMVGSSLTPLGVTFANVDYNSWHGEAGEYPSRFVNIALYHAPNLSIDDYARQDLQAKKMSPVTTSKSVGGKAGIKQIGRFKQDDQSYVSAYTKQGDDIIIIESIVKDTDKAALTDTFERMLDSVSFNK